MKTKWAKKATIGFALFGTTILCVVGVLVFTMLNSPSRNNELATVNKGAILFDDKSMQVVCNEPGTIISTWNDDYMFVSENKERISLGKNSVVIDQNKFYIIGGGYRIQKDASVYKLDNFFETNNTETQFYKLADRKYLMIAGTIVDDQEIISTSGYLYILLDRQGNAQLINNDVAAKTQVPTTLTGDDLTFDIANEIFKFGDTLSVDMKDVIGTTNEFDPMTYKNPLTEETNLNPEEIDIDVKGGDGGEGGSGGEGGTGGTGGTGGKGSNAEQSDLVKEIMLLGVDRGSTYLNVKYHAADPFAQYGLIFLALYPGDTDLTIPANRASQVIENQMYGVNVYQNEMSFYNLEPDKSYQVVIGHIIDGEDDWFVDDVIKTTTQSITNSVNLISQTSTKLSYEIKLDKYYDSFTKGKIIASRNQISQDGSTGCRYDLIRFNGETDVFDVSSATSSEGIVVPVPYIANNIKESNIIKIDIVLSKDGSFGNNQEDTVITVLSNSSVNGYYDGTKCAVNYTAKYYDGFNNDSISYTYKDGNNNYIVIGDTTVQSGNMLTMPTGLDKTYLRSKYPNATLWGVKFVGWKVQDYTYDPGDSIRVTTETTITASWGCPANASLKQQDGNITCECDAGFIPKNLEGGGESCVVVNQSGGTTTTTSSGGGSGT